MVEKVFLKMPNLLMLIKLECITSKKPSSHDMTAAELLIVFSTKVNLLHFLCLSAPKVLSSESDKAKLFAENFSKNFNLEHSDIYLHAFPSRTNLQLQNTY